MQYVHDETRYIAHEQLGHVGWDALRDNIVLLTEHHSDGGTPSATSQQNASETAMVRNLMGRNLKGAKLLQFLATSGYIWTAVEQVLHLVNGAPMRWAKVAALSRQLEQGQEAVVFFDYDVTIRPDCFGAARLLKDLFAPTLQGAVPHIVVRDAPVGVDCLNSGFVALRKTPVAELFLQLWKGKMTWPGVMHGDQGALAETLLELLDLEYRIVTPWPNGRVEESKGYDHRCLRYLLPDERGLKSWRQYCDCYQAYLETLAGPFEHRHSVFVRFVSPRNVDFNYIPNSLTPSHSQDLRRMRLLPAKHPPLRVSSGPRDDSLDSLPKAFSPLVVHWAGIANRSKLMKEYMVRRFQVPPTVFRKGRERAERCRALLPLSPRSNANCAAGGTGTMIEHIFQSWEYESGGSLYRKIEFDANATLTRENQQGLLAEVQATWADDGSPVKASNWSIVDHSRDPWTVSNKFREDLVEGLGGKTATLHMTILEIGSYLGYTTLFLAMRFRRTLSVDKNATRLAAARELLSAAMVQNQTTLLQLDTQKDSWDPVVEAAKAAGGVDVVMVHGEQDYQEHLINDVRHALFSGLGRVERRYGPLWLVLPDAFLRAEVAQTLLDYVDGGLLRVTAALGYKEGVLCEVLLDKPA
eukprot:TRINITY_DN32505_c0_g1_i2.p1 TRINITY_DN32505_c0_g1~~TRINITY_DN32505_c0_g1_i2.p1  ORF type:complete len:639 (-),score=122.23 TRINITY_DN32505_c0_g1_i2:134-2050(-)